MGTLQIREHCVVSLPHSFWRNIWHWNTLTAVLHFRLLHVVRHWGASFPGGFRGYAEKLLWHLGLVRFFLPAFQMENFSGTLACTLRPRLVCLQQQFASGQEHVSEANDSVNPSKYLLDCIMEWPCITGNQSGFSQLKLRGAVWHCTWHTASDNGLKSTGQNHS